MTFFITGDDIADLDVMNTIFFKYRSITTDDEYLIGSDGVDTKRGWCLLILNNVLTFRNYYSNTQYNELSSTTDIRDDAWHSISITCNSSTNVYTLLIDGLSVDSGTFTETHLVGDKLSVGLKYWHGLIYGLKVVSLIDSLRIYNSVKSTTNIVSLTNFRPDANEVPDTERNTVGLLATKDFESEQASNYLIPSLENIGDSVDFSDITLDNFAFTPTVLQELNDINLENVPILYNEDILKDLNLIGDIPDLTSIRTIPTITPIEVTPASFTIPSTSITVPDGETATDLEISTGDIPEINTPDIETPDPIVQITPVTIDVVTEPTSESTEVETTVDPVDATSPTYDTMTIENTVKSRFVTALSYGDVKIDIGNSGETFVSFWMYKKANTSPNIKAYTTSRFNSFRNRNHNNFRTPQNSFKPFEIISERNALVLKFMSVQKCLFPYFYGRSEYYNSHIARQNDRQVSSGGTWRTIYYKQYVTKPHVSGVQWPYMQTYRHKITWPSDYEGWTHIAFGMGRNGIFSSKDGVTRESAPIQDANKTMTKARIGFQAAGIDPSKPYVDWEINESTDTFYNWRPSKWTYYRPKQKINTYDYKPRPFLNTLTGASHQCALPTTHELHPVNAPFQISPVKFYGYAYYRGYIIPSDFNGQVNLSRFGTAMYRGSNPWASNTKINNFAQIQSIIENGIAPVDNNSYCLPLNNIKMEITARNSTAIDDVKVYDLNQWSSFLLQELANG